MAVKNPKKTIPDSTSQRYLPFSQLRDNVIVMKDGGVRVVLRCSTINFLLKSIEEQDSIIMSYQRFLNSLDFPVQIMIRSTKLDIDTYLSKLGDMALKQKNSLLQNQTYEYIEYLKKLIEVAQIMKKEFYIIIPFDEVENKTVRDTSLLGSIGNFWKAINGNDDITKIKLQRKSLERMKKGLVNRVNSVRTSLESIGIKVQELDKNELIRFLMEYYEPRMDSFTAMKSGIDDYNITK